MYDVLGTCNLISYYKYTCDTISVSTFNGLLHAITRQGIETYTVRMYAAASDWIRKNAAVDIQVDQADQVESATCNFDEQDGDLLEVTDVRKKSDEDLENRTVEDFSVEIRSSPDSASGGIQSENLSPTNVVDQEHKENVHVEQDLEKPCVTEDIPPSAAPTSSNTDSVDSKVVDSPDKSTRPSGDEFPPESSAGNKETDSSPSDIKLTVDNSGRTLVRFTSGSKTSLCDVSKKGIQFEETEQSNDGEHDAELTASQRTRTFAVSNPLNRNSSAGAKVSDAVYQAALSKLSSDCGWPLPVFDLESLRQVCLTENKFVVIIIKVIAILSR